MTKIPTHVFRPYPTIDGSTFEIRAWSPELLIDFASDWLERRNAESRSAIVNAMEHPEPDLLAHDAAWIHWHALVGLDNIESNYKEWAKKIRGTWEEKK
jgi:hypothetical protein